MHDKPAPEDIEVAIGPHPARRGWSVLRVAYRRGAPHEGRVSRALGALFPAAGPGEAHRCDTEGAGDGTR